MTTCHVFSSLADQTRSLRLKVQKVTIRAEESIHLLIHFRMQTSGGARICLTFEAAHRCSIGGVLLAAAGRSYVEHASLRSTLIFIAHSLVALPN